MENSRFFYYLWKTNWIKTLWFNIKYLPLSKAIYLPYFISRHTSIKCCKESKIIIVFGAESGGIHPCMYKLGYANVPTQSVKSDPLCIFLSKGSTLTIMGGGRISAGTQIYLMENADVTIGYNTYISMDVKIYSQHSIAIGSYSTIGWGSQIVDSDLHDVIDINTGVAFPQGKRIIIGDHVWVCNSCSITKGTVIPNDVIVGARSLCNKEYDVPRYSVIAGTPAKYIKEGLRYEH